MGQKPTIFDTKLKAKEWQWQLKTEMKGLEREIKKIKQAQAKIEKEIQEQAALGNVAGVQMLATQVVRSKKAVERLEKTKLSMKGVELQITTAIASMGTAASIQLSANVMKEMNQIAGMPEVSGVMASMRKEMATMSEAEDSIEAALKTEGEDTAAAFEVQRVLDDMALNQMGPLAAAAAASAAAAPAAPAEAAAPGFNPPQRVLIAEGGVPAAPKKPAAAPVIQPPKAAAPVIQPPNAARPDEATVKMQQEVRATGLIHELYNRHAPDKFAQVQEILQNASGSRWDFYVKCCEKYGEAPADVGAMMMVETAVAAQALPAVAPVAAPAAEPEMPPPTGTFTPADLDDPLLMAMAAAAAPAAPAADIYQAPASAFSNAPPVAVAAAPPKGSDDDLMARLANLKM